jgi:hypothetical protein
MWLKSVSDESVYDVSQVLGQHCFDNQFVFPVETLTKNLDILKYRNKRCKSVDTSLKITLWIVFWILIRTRLLRKRYVERDRSSVPRKVMHLCLGNTLTLFTLTVIVRENCVKYGIAWLLKIVNRYNVHVDILLKPSIGIVSLNWRWYFHPHSMHWTKDIWTSKVNRRYDMSISICFNYAQAKEYARAFNYKIS